MNIKNSVTRLTESQKQALHDIFKKLQDNKKLSSEDVGLLGFSIESCKGVFIMSSFDIAKMTLSNWNDAGCPRNKDGTYNLRLMIEWRINREKEKYDGIDPKRDQEILRLENQNRKLELEIADKEKKTISKELYLEKLHTGETELRNFWTDGYKRNAPEMMTILNVSADKKQVFLEEMDKWVKSGMDAFIEGWKEDE